MSLQPNPIKLLQREPRSLNRQQGVVIVVALFIVMLVAAMSYAMLARVERDTRRTSLMIHNTEAEFYAQGSIAWAIDQLYNNWIRQKTHQPIDVMPARSPVSEVKGYRIRSVIEDMQARFNVNNLSHLEARADFSRLLRAVSPSLSEQKAQEIALAVADWITPNQQENEYSRYYLALATPYRPAHRFLISSSELRLVKGINAKLFQALQPYVVALPVYTPINVQTAATPVLMSLSADMDKAAAQAIEKNRLEKPVISSIDFNQLDIMKNHPIANNNVTTVSSFFLIATEVTREEQHLLLYTLVERTATANKAVIRKVWQSKGVW